MSAGLTSLSSVEVEEYCEAVRSALAELAPEVRDDLLEDLPDHLTEVLAEGDGALRDRLGEPAAYASELRSAVGLDPTDAAPNAVTPTIRARVTDAAHRVMAVGDQASRHLGRLLGYPRLGELARAVRPGWWVLRGWLLAQLLCGIRTEGGWRGGLIPEAGHSRLGGALITVLAVVGSIWLGHWSRRFSIWPRSLVTAASIAVAVWAVIVLAGQSNVGRTTYVVVPAANLSATNVSGPSPSGYETGGLIGGPTPTVSGAAPSGGPSPTGSR